MCHVFRFIMLLIYAPHVQVHDAETKGDVQQYSVSAIRHLQLSIETDPGDHLAHFYLGLHLASVR